LGHGRWRTLVYFIVNLVQDRAGVLRTLLALPLALTALGPQAFGRDDGRGHSNLRCGA
jgi:hypothetical protein